MATNGTVAPETRKTPLFELAVQADYVQEFMQAAEAAGHKVYSFSANGPADWYYDAVKRYVEDHVGGEDDGSTYVVLNAIALYIGQTQDEYDVWAAQRKEEMGAGAADRLAKARAKNAQRTAGLESMVQSQADMIAELKAMLEKAGISTASAS